MYESVIVPLDCTRSAEAALPAALTLARQAGTTLRLIAVVEAPDTLVAWSRRGRSGAWMAERENDARSYLDGVAAQLGYSNVGTHAVIGEPAWSILTEVDESQQPVLVMARRTRSALRERFSRGITLRVARQARCPMVIVPTSAEADLAAEFRLRSMLAPLDRSRLAERVLQALTGEVLNPEGLHIHLLSVIETAAWHGSGQAVMYSYNFDRYVADMRGVAMRYLSRMHESLTSAGARVTCDVRVGRVAEQICLAAEEAQVDLIAMSTHGRSGLERFMLGSVAEAVVAEAHRPVLLIRAAA